MKTIISILILTISILTMSICFAGNLETFLECRPEGTYTSKTDFLDISPSYTASEQRIRVNQSIIPAEVIGQAEWDACEIAADLKIAKTAKKAIVKAEGLALMQIQIPGIKDFETAEMFKEFILSVKAEARDLTPKVQAVSDYWSAGAASIADVNALTTEQQVTDYEIVWP